MSKREAQVPTDLGNNGLYCVFHPQELYQRFCKDCDCFVCIECITSKHEGHSYSKIKEAYGETGKELRACIHLLKQVEMTKIETIKLVQTNQTDYVQQTENLVTQVSKKAEEIKHTVDTLRDETTEELQTAKTESLLCLQQIESVLKAKLTELHDFIQTCENKATLATEEDLTSLIIEIKTRLNKKYKPEEFVPISPSGFIPMETEKVVLKGMYGYIRQISGERLVKKIPRKGFVARNPVPVLLDKEETKTNVQETSYQRYASAVFEIDYFPIALTAQGQGKAWICDAYGNLLLFYQDGSPITSAKVDSGVGGIAVTSNGELIITNSERNKVMKLTKDGQFVDLMDSSPYHPHGVCISLEGEIIVTMQHNSRDGKIVRLSNTGEIIQTIKNGFLFKSLFKKPWFITENINQDLWVQDGEQGNVIVIDKNGTRKFTYRGPDDDSLKALFTPTGLTHNKQGHVLIADQANAAIHQVDAEGNILAIFTTNPAVTIPCFIDEDSSGYLWTCSFVDKKIIVLKKFEKNNQQL